MGCSRGLCAAEKIFIFINIAFAMYAGALLATAARLAWDPSTYTWFRFLCRAQYRASAAFVLAAGLWLAALVYLAAAAARRDARLSDGKRMHARPLHVYTVGVACLAVSEVGYGAWMATSLAQWWRTAPEAELARRGADVLHDLKPALLAVERYRDIARPLIDMIEEVEREAPNNVFVIIIFGVLGIILQVAAIVMARRLSRSPGTWGPVEGAGGVVGEAECAGDKERAFEPALEHTPCACAPDDSDSVHSPRAAAGPGWRKAANLRMYTILDKIF